MNFKDLHTHTVYSDGKNTSEEMVLAAISIGMTEIGISDHSYTEFDTCYCMKKEDIKKRVDEINGLKIKYADKIKVLCGIEQDYFSAEDTGIYDYVIGSVHYIKKDGEYIPVDEDRKILLSAAKRLYGGDIYALIDDYYEEVGDIVAKTGADVVGHFDLITKLNDKDPLFSEDDPRYKKAWKKAADKLLKTGAVFEINTGAISRGYKKYPYPAVEIKRYLEDNGAKFINSSDSHSAEILIKSNLELF